jgi:DNA-binding NarL/FixJ family response regulator
MSMPISVILVDDHVLMLNGLKELLDKEADLHVVAALSDPCTLKQTITRQRPDVLVLDVRLKAQNGIAIAGQLKNEFPALKIIILSGYHYREYIEAADQAGADAYVTKETSNSDLTRAIRAVHLGRRVFPNLNPVPQGKTLTPKEREILKLIAADLTNAEIGEELSISKRTVEYHVTSIIQKLGVDSRLGAVVIAIKKGLLDV